MTANKLFYCTQKIYKENGETYKMNVHISLDDNNKNGIYFWSIIGCIYKKCENGRYYKYYSGPIHDEILKQFPEFKTFVNLHLSTCYGNPLYAVENGLYFIRKNKHDEAVKYLRISENEYNILKKYNNEMLFKYQLYALHIVDRWEQESLEAIKQLEALTGDTWKNPYKPENERFVIRLTDEERTLIEKTLN